MAPSGGAQLLQVWMMLTLAAFFFFCTFKMAGQKWLGQSSKVFFFVGSYILRMEVWFFFRWGGVMDGVYHGRSFSGFQRYPAWGSTRRAGAGWAGWASRGTMCNHEMSWVVEIETAIAISSQVRKALRNIDSENYELFVPKNLNFQSLHGMATSAPLALHLTRGAGEQQPIRADCLEVDSGSCAPSFGRCLHQSSNWSEMKIPSFPFSQRLPFSIFSFLD